MYRNSLYTNQENYLGKLICFIICPFFTFLYCFKNAKSKSSQLILFLGGLLFAWSMHYTNVYRGIDFIEIINAFYFYPSISFGDIIDGYKNMFEDNGELRNYNLVVFSIARLFSDNYHFMFVIAAIPFTYCMIRSVSLITSEVKFSNNTLCLIILLLFILPKDFFSIQNFRFATATWVGLYATIQILQYDRKRYFAILLLTPLIHTSFLFYLGIFAVYLIVLSSKISFIKKLYFCSIPFAFLSADLFSQINISFLPPTLQGWFNAYMSESSFKVYGNMSYMNGSGFFFIPATFFLIRSLLYVLIPIVISKNTDIRLLDSKTQKMFYFFIIFFAITNIVQCVPSLGSRFFGLARIFSIFIWFKVMYPKFNKYVYYIFFSCLFEIIFEVRTHYAMVLDWNFYFMNAISLITKYIGVSSFI